MYQSKLDLIQTEIGIKLVKDNFERNLAQALNLVRVSAPLFVTEDSGLNDNLNGYERPVKFDVLETGRMAEVVQSLAKWKRMALAQYKFTAGTGLYTDMNAIRRDEVCDATHSLYVDQWDWEKIIDNTERNLNFLEVTIQSIYTSILETAKQIEAYFPELKSDLPKDIICISSQELEDMYPEYTAFEREYVIAKKYGAVFITGIGGALKSGKIHDNRAPDYDDWDLNGDLIVYYKSLDKAIELSSMGIRVDRESLLTQLEVQNAMERMRLPYHQALLNGQLPLTIGGGIGQSRLCMILLQKVHIGEVQNSIWPDQLIKECNDRNIFLL